MIRVVNESSFNLIESSSTQIYKDRTQIDDLSM